MGYNYNQITTPGVEHGPYLPLDPDNVKISIDEYDEPVDEAHIQAEHQLLMNADAVLQAWVEQRISSEEEQSRTAAIFAAMP